MRSLRQPRAIISKIVVCSDMALGSTESHEQWLRECHIKVAGTFGLRECLKRQENVKEAFYGKGNSTP
jgi:hypothetical protein